MKNVMNLYNSDWYVSSLFCYKSAKEYIFIKKNIESVYSPLYQQPEKDKQVWKIDFTNPIVF